jgi:hypothetical protein
MQKGTLVPWRFDPHVMAIDMNRRNWNKKINPHLTRSTGIDRGEREDRRMVFAFF